MAKDPTGPGLGDSLARTLVRVDGLVLRVGWLDPAAAAIAAPNERGGDPGPPQRATLEPALDESRGLIGDLTAEAVRDAAAGRSARPALALGGELFGFSERSGNGRTGSPGATR